MMSSPVPKTGWQSRLTKLSQRDHSPLLTVALTSNLRDLSATTSLPDLTSVTKTPRMRGLRISYTRMLIWMLCQMQTLNRLSVRSFGRERKARNLQASLGSNLGHQCRGFWSPYSKGKCYTSQVKKS